MVDDGDVVDAIKMPENKGGGFFALRFWKWNADIKDDESYE